MNKRLIAHRGEPESLPENSLAGFRKALEAGALFLETDVHLTADGVAVLCHDPDLSRMTGHDLVIAQSTYAEIRDIPAGQPELFGHRYQEFRIERLEDLVALLVQWPMVQLFVELKQASLDAFGTGGTVDRVNQMLRPVAEQCILISFNSDALRHARSVHDCRIGWVLGEWSDNSRVLANRLAPEFLFVNRKRLPPSPQPLWKGGWQWVLYTVNELAELAPFMQRGFEMIETNAISRLLAESFGHGSAHD